MRRYIMTIYLKIIYATRVASGIGKRILILFLKLFDICILRLLKKEPKKFWGTTETVVLNRNIPFITV